MIVLDYEPLLLLAFSVKERQPFFLQHLRVAGDLVLQEFLALALYHP